MLNLNAGLGTEKDNVSVSSTAYATLNCRKPSEDYSGLGSYGDFADRHEILLKTANTVNRFPSIHNVADKYFPTTGLCRRAVLVLIKPNNPLIFLSSISLVLANEIYHGEPSRVGTTKKGRQESMIRLRKLGWHEHVWVFKGLLPNCVLVFFFYQSAWLRLLTTFYQMQKLFLSLQMDFLMLFLYCSLTFYLVSREENPIYWCNLNVIVSSERNSFN